MSSVAITPRSACSAAIAIARCSAGISAMEWSAGIATMIASSPSWQAASAASVSAGAVSRRAGSTMMRVFTPDSRVCSSVVKRYSSPQTMIGSAAIWKSPEKSFMRPTVACNSESRPMMPINCCFGNCSRDIGQRRVPEPPARMTGTMRRHACSVTFSTSAIISLAVRASFIISGFLLDRRLV